MPASQPAAGPRCDGIVPEWRSTLPAAALVAAAAAVASHAGTLPGRSLPVLGPAAHGALWAALCLGLARAGASVLPGHGSLARSARRRIAVCLLLALATTQAARIALESLRGPKVWATFFYLAWLVPPAMMLLWFTVLMPRTTRAAYRSAKADPAGAPLLALCLFLFWAAVLTSVGDIAFEWGGGTPVNLRLKRDVIQPSAWASNVLILSGGCVLAFAATTRLATTLLLVSSAYVLLCLGTLAKLRFLHAAVQPLDLLRLPELAPLLPSFFGGAAIIAAVAAGGLWLCGLIASASGPSWRLTRAVRWSLGLGSLVMLGAFPTAFHLAPSHSWVRALLRVAGAPDVQHREKARSSGPLLTFLSELPAALVAAPPTYSADAVAGALRVRRASTLGTPAAIRAGHVDLIVYLVESFMDPDDLGLRYTSDPVPNLRALARSHSAGYAIVPEPFGGSANTEFELLSGMTTAFLPRGSLPFRQYVRSPIPSLPRALADLGFATVAIQADARYYYNRERVYDLLGFQRVVWLNESPSVERAARPGWPSDQAMVRAVIEVSRGRHPFLAFAFPSSTHSPYTSGVYGESDLDVLHPPPGDSVGEVKEYINTLRVADRAIGMLIEHFRRQPDSTIIAILGDHLAPLSTDALGPFFSGLSGLPEAERARRTRRVPLVVWANFRLPREEIEVSVNGLPSYLLELMGMPAPDFLALTGDVRMRIPVVSSYLRGAGGEVWSWDSLPAAERALLEDYRLLQYDLLLGKRYSLRPDTSGPRATTR